MFKSKKLVALGLAAVALFSTVGVSLAYWASSVSGASKGVTGTINVGTGSAVTTQVNVSDIAAVAGQTLVPPGYGGTDGKVESVTLDFSISWNDTAGDSDGAVGTLAVTRGTYTVGGAADPDGLVNISANPSNVSITSGASALHVTYTVTLDEPANLAQYNLVAGKAIVINFSFVVTVA